MHEKFVDDALFLMITHDVNAARDEPQGQGVRPGAELVPGFLAGITHGQAEVTAAAQREAVMPAYAGIQSLAVIPVRAGIQ